MKPKRPPTSYAISVLMALLAALATCVLVYNEHVERVLAEPPRLVPSGGSP